MLQSLLLPLSYLDVAGMYGSGCHRLGSRVGMMQLTTYMPKAYVRQQLHWLSSCQA